MTTEHSLETPRLPDISKASHCFFTTRRRISGVNIWGERASLFELEASGPAGHLEGVGKFASHK